MASWCWDQRGYDANEIVMHVTWITKSRRASRHNCRYLRTLAFRSMERGFAHLLVDLFAEMTAPERVAYLPQFGKAHHYQAPQPSRHSV